MHKIVHHTAPDYLVEILPNTVNADTHYNLRNSEDLQQFTFRTEKFRKSVLPDCIRKWNSLDSNIQNESSITSFKNLIDINEKSCPLYSLGIRKLNIIHAQLRMECSNLNAHLFNLHVIDSPECSCSYYLEDTAHFLLDCPLYLIQRIDLRNTVSNIAIFNVNTLLYGDCTLDYDSNVIIMLAVQKFIQNSERFM